MPLPSFLFLLLPLLSIVILFYLPSVLFLVLSLPSYVIRPISVLFSSYYCSWLLFCSFCSCPPPLSAFCSLPVSSSVIFLLSVPCVPLIIIPLPLSLFLPVSALCSPHLSHSVLFLCSLSSQSVPCVPPHPALSASCSLSAPVLHLTMLRPCVSLTQRPGHRSSRWPDQSERLCLPTMCSQTARYNTPPLIYSPLTLSPAFLQQVAPALHTAALALREAVTLET